MGISTVMRMVLTATNMGFSGITVVISHNPNFLAEQLGVFYIGYNDCDSLEA
jgi:hypothetical protein